MKKTVAKGNHIKMNFTGAGKATLGIWIKVRSYVMTMGLSYEIEQVSSRGQRCNLCRSRNLLHGHSLAHSSDSFQVVRSNIKRFY